MNTPATTHEFEEEMNSKILLTETENLALHAEIADLLVRLEALGAGCVSALRPKADRERAALAAAPQPQQIAEPASGWLDSFISERRRSSWNSELHAHEAAAINLFLGELEKARKAALEAKDVEIAKLKSALKFVERWANHHGTKPHMTAEEALGCIQHYPPIRAITKSYADGKVPETRDPYAEIATQSVEIKGLRKDAERYRRVRSNPAMLLHLSSEEFDFAIDAAIAKEAVK